MEIKILGTGCPNCKKLEANVVQALGELKLEARVEKVTDIQDIMNYGIMSLPALVVNKKVAAAGLIPGVEDIKNLLAEGDNNLIKENDGAGCCACGGK